MSKPFLTPIDLGKLEIQNAVIQNLAAPPSSPVDGQIYFNTVSGMMFIYSTILLGWVGLGSLSDINLAQGDVDLNSKKIINLAAPLSGGDATNRTYVLGRSLSEFAVPTADVAWNAKKITGVLDPTNAQDAATKNYVDGMYAGLSWKDSVRVASTANITIASALITNSTVDGVLVLTGDRVLLKNQTAPAENGIYTVVASGAASRTTDADSATEILGASVFVEEGTVSADTAWILSTNAPITLNTTSLTFTQFFAGSAYTAGTGLLLTGTVFSIENGGVLLPTHGGTGLATATANGVLIGNGTSAMTVTAEGASNTVLHGNTGADPTFSAVNLASADVTGTLTVNKGGTGVATITSNGVMIGNGTSAITATAEGATGTVLRGATGADPAFGQVVLTTDVSGTLPVANGGIGAATLTDHGVLLGSGTAAISPTAVGATGTVLRGQTGADPIFGAVALTTDVTGTLPVANGGTAGATVAAAKTALGFMSRYAVTYGDGAAVSYTITHNLGTLDVIVSVFKNSDGVEAVVDVTHATTNTITLIHAVAPASNAYRVVIIG